MADVTNITTNGHVDFTPEMGNYKALQPFRYWCQKVLPLVYDDSLSYYELLCKVVDYLNKTMEDVETLHGDVTNIYKAYGELQENIYGAYDELKENIYDAYDELKVNIYDAYDELKVNIYKAYEELQEYVNNYFNSLDVQEEINNKLDMMVEDGTLPTIILETLNKRYVIIDNTMSTEEINLKINQTSGAFIYFKSGVYAVELFDNTEVTNSYTGIVFNTSANVFFDDVTFTIENDNIHKKYEILCIYNANCVNIGGKVNIIGNKDNFESLDGEEFGYGLSIRASKNLSIKGVYSTKCIGDGFFINNVSFSEISMCKAYSCRRQGMSIISADNLCVHDCWFYDIDGTAPKGAIDLEPNYQDERLENINIYNIYSKNTYGVYVDTHNLNQNNKVSIYFNNIYTSTIFIRNYASGEITFSNCSVKSEIDNRMPFYISNQLQSAIITIKDIYVDTENIAVPNNFRGALILFYADNADISFINLNFLNISAKCSNCKALVTESKITENSNITIVDTNNFVCNVSNVNISGIKKDVENITSPYSKLVNTITITNDYSSALYNVGGDDSVILLNKKSSQLAYNNKVIKANTAYLLKSGNIIELNEIV